MNYWQRAQTERLRRRRLLGAGVAAAAGGVGLSLVGCGDDDDNTQPQSGGGGAGGPPATAQASPPTAGRKINPDAEVRTAWGAFPGNLDQQTVGGRAGTTATNFQHNASIFAVDEKNLPINGGAADFEIVNNNTA